MSELPCYYLARLTSTADPREILGSRDYGLRLELNWRGQWRVFFLRLERLHYLDKDNPEHLWLLHFLFLPMINEDCNNFRVEWNNHPIGGTRGNDKTPSDMRLLGMAEHGIYDEDDCDGLTVEEIEASYGVFGRERTRHQQQTGAGHYDEEEDGEDGEDGEGEEDEEDEDLEEESVQVELTQSPFPNAQLRAVFEGALQETVNATTSLPKAMACSCKNGRTANTRQRRSCRWEERDRDRW